MSFSNPFSIKTTGTSEIGASEINAAGVSISKAVDGTGGGSYSPVAKIQIAGAGLEHSDGGWPLLDARTITRIEQTKIVPTADWTATKWGADGDYILFGEAMKSGVPVSFFDGIVGSTLYTWLEFFPINGAQITSMSVIGARDNLGAPGTVTNAPVYQAMKMNVATGDMGNLGPSSTATFTTSYTDDSVAVSTLVDRSSERYFMTVTHPIISTNFCALLVRAVKATYSVSQMQL